MPKKHILITNIVTLNGGDAAILFAEVEMIRKTFSDDVDFIVYDKHANIAERYYPEFVFRPWLYDSVCGKVLPGVRGMGRYFGYIARRIASCIGPRCFLLAARLYKKGYKRLARFLLNAAQWKELKTYFSASIIVSTGGTYLIPQYSLKPRLFEYEVSLLTGVPLVFFTQSIGSFTRQSDANKLRRIFNGAALILVRDRYSFANLATLGISSSRIRIRPDAAFLFAETDRFQKKELEHKPVERRMEIAISVREWDHFEQLSKEEGMARYKRSIASAVEYCSRIFGANITFLSTCQGIQQYTDDSVVAAEIMAMLDQQTRSHVHLDNSYNHPFGLMNRLKKFDWVLSTRMHMLIFALCVGTPALPIAYGFKTRELYQQMGLGKFVSDMGNISSASLISSIDSFVEQFDEINQILTVEVSKLKEQSAAAMQDIASIVQ